MYDIAIVGSGPAAVSAALNFKLHNKEIIWFGTKDMSGKVEKSEKIANYPGVAMVSGKELNDRFQKQLEEMNIEITEKMVTNISKNKKGFMLLADNDIFDARAVLLCIGATAAKGFAGETELLGRGVSYCATCDGFLYKGRTIAVFCGSEKYEHEVSYLADIAEKVYLFAPYRDVSVKLPNVLIQDKQLKEITGDKKVKSIVRTDGEEIAVDGVFVLRNAVAPATLLPGLNIEGAHIVVNRAQETNIAGCFAAGDCTGRPYQIAKAVGEGNVAAHSILEYLDEMEKEVLV